MRSPGSTLARLTAAKAVANTALRWIPPFLPTLERALGATTAQLTTILGVGELAGLSTVAAGPRLDRGREPAIVVGSLGLVTASSLIALIGSVFAFAVAFFVLVLGVANLTVAGQAWISHRVPYSGRARALGLFETSWALSLLLGAPLVAVLINLFGWRGPFAALAVASAAAAVLMARTLPRAGGPEPIETVDLDAPARRRTAGRPTRSTRPTAAAWLVITGSALTAMAGLAVFVISGAWLDDAFGVSTGGVGAIAVTFGAAELVASLASAGFADRVGKLRSTLAGLVVLGAGLVVMVVAGTRLVVGVAGLLLFLLGFEFAFVTSLSLVSEAMPAARGATLATGNAVGTFARAAGAVVSGWLYSSSGLAATAAFAGASATAAFCCLALSTRASS